MRVPLLWLYDHCAPELSVRELAERLTMTGTKVERVHHHGVEQLDRFVVGKVLEALPHPDADRLTVCSVDVGEGEPAQIVCGAPNVAAGQTVAVARPGAVMPDGTKLGRAKLRGVSSDGMILAEDELSIGTDHDGTMVLPDGPAPGSALADVLPISTEVLELEITPNRPDCLSVYGIAREVHAATGARLGPEPWAQDPGSDGPLEGASVTVQAPELCPRFTVRGFEGVVVGQSPPWLKARLMAAGQRPISNVVDITNYVMLLTGQPLHAFDWDRVAGGALVVRRAQDGERLVTLDGVERVFDPEVVLVCDADGPSGIGGVMGGQRSEVSEPTNRVLMEAATWVGPNIQRTSTRLALRSEASGRFEKQLQPEQAIMGLALATTLMVELCGARIVPGTIDVGGPGPDAVRIDLRESEVTRLLGRSIARGRCAEILGSLGFGTEMVEGGVSTTVPALRRGDVTREADLVEEVARIDGFESLPATLPARRGASGRLTTIQRRRRRVEDAMLGAGLDEIVGWSLVAPETPERLRLSEGDPRARHVALLNPMSEEQSVLRTTLLVSLLQAAGHNAARGAGALRLWEAGPVYLQRDKANRPDEHHHLGALISGPARTPTWRDGSPGESDFFTAKAALATALASVRVTWRLQPATEPFLHPGRSARVIAGESDVGWIGEVHPLVSEAFEAPGGSGFEIDLDAALATAADVETYTDLTSFPEVRQDLAVTVGEEVSAEAVVSVVRAAGGPLLASAEVFDVYRGQQVVEGRVSLALSLAFRAGDRTLTDEEVAGLHAQIVDALGAELGGELRGA